MSKTPLRCLCGRKLRTKKQIAEELRTLRYELGDSLAERSAVHRRAHDNHDAYRDAVRASESVLHRAALHAQYLLEQLARELDGDCYPCRHHRHAEDHAYEDHRAGRSVAWAVSEMKGYPRWEAAYRFERARLADLKLKSAWDLMPGARPCERCAAPLASSNEGTRCDECPAAEATRARGAAAAAGGAA